MDAPPLAGSAMLTVTYELLKAGWVSAEECAAAGGVDDPERVVAVARREKSPIASKLVNGRLMFHLVSWGKKA